jgi:hypothetical protein
LELQLGDAGTIETSMDTGEEQGSAEAELSDSVEMSFRDSLNHAGQAESSQVIRSFCPGDGGGHLSGEHRYLLG